MEPDSEGSTIDATPPGDGEILIPDSLIATLITHRVANGTHASCLLGVAVTPNHTDSGVVWDLDFEMKTGLGGDASQTRTYKFRGVAYRMFDWAVDEFGLEERHVLPDDAPEDVIEMRMDVLSDTDSTLFDGVER